MTRFTKKIASLIAIAAVLFSTAADAQHRGNQPGGRNNHPNPGNRPQHNNNVQRNFHNNNNVNHNRTVVNQHINRTVTTTRINNNYRRPVYSATNPSWRYANRPRRNTIIRTVPTTYRTINYGGFGYRYNNGIFYRPYNNQFMVIAPPIGIHINILPVGYRRIIVHDHPYYYYNGTYYDSDGADDYSVVSPPVGAVVESIPDGFETVVIDGETYYTVDGAQYKPVVQDNGEIWYEVIKAN